MEIHIQCLHNDCGGDIMVLEDLASRQIYYGNVKISIPKATTFYGTVKLFETDKQLSKTYKIPQGSQIFFGVKEKVSDVNYKIKKFIPADAIIGDGYPFVLSPEQTDLPYGEYLFDVGIQFPDGNFYIAVRHNTLLIDKAITQKGVTS